MIEGIYIIVIMVVSFLLIVMIFATIVNKSKINRENKMSRNQKDTSKMRFEKSGEIRYHHEDSKPSNSKKTRNNPQYLNANQVKQSESMPNVGIKKVQPIASDENFREEIVSIDTPPQTIHQETTSANSAKRVVVSGSLKNEIQELLRQNKNVQAIKRVRDETGLSLVDSKKIVEELNSRL